MVFKNLPVKPQFIVIFLRALGSFVHLTTIAWPIYVEAAWCYLQTSPNAGSEDAITEVGIQRDQYRTAA